MLNNALAYLIDVVFGLFTYTLLLRLVMQLVRAPFRNPLGQAVMALTDWIVKPLRKALPGFGGVDWASLVAAVLFQFAWLLALQLTFGRAFALLGPGSPSCCSPRSSRSSRRCCGSSSSSCSRRRSCRGSHRMDRSVAC